MDPMVLRMDRMMDLMDRMMESMLDVALGSMTDSKMDSVMER